MTASRCLPRGVLTSVVASSESALPQSTSRFRFKGWVTSSPASASTCAAHVLRVSRSLSLPCRAHLLYVGLFCFHVGLFYGWCRVVRLRIHQNESHVNGNPPTRHLARALHSKPKSPNPQTLNPARTRHHARALLHQLVTLHQLFTLHDLFTPNPNPQTLHEPFTLERFRPHEGRSGFVFRVWGLGIHLERHGVGVSV